jgi:hypothetical protein
MWTNDEMENGMMKFPTSTNILLLKFRFHALKNMEILSMICKMQNKILCKDDRWKSNVSLFGSTTPDPCTRSCLNFFVSVNKILSWKILPGICP